MARARSAGPPGAGPTATAAAAPTWGPSATSSSARPTAPCSATAGATARTGATAGGRFPPLWWLTSLTPECHLNLEKAPRKAS